jgi:MYXO-CTERM domain-containing protein
MAISDSIVTPRMKAQMTIDAHPYLTRLNTFISPAEMTKDPFFFEAKDLPDVSNVHRATIQTICGNGDYYYCAAPQRVMLPDGRTFWLRHGSKDGSCQYGASQDVTDLKSLPAAHVVWARELEGAGTVITDNSKMISATLDAHNKKFAAEEAMSPPPPVIPGTAGTGGSFAGSGGGYGGTFGGYAGTLGSMGVGGSWGGTDPHGSHGSGGCGCQLGHGGGNAPLLAGLAGVALGALSRRRRSAK